MNDQGTNLKNHMTLMVISILVLIRKYNIVNSFMDNNFRGIRKTFIFVGTLWFCGLPKSDYTRTENLSFVGHWNSWIHSYHEIRKKMVSNENKRIHSESYHSILKCSVISNLFHKSLTIWWCIYLIPIWVITQICYLHLQRLLIQCKKACNFL